MEIVIWLEQKMHDVWHKMTRALFVFAARDANNEGPAIVNALEPANEREKAILSGGHLRQQKRFALMKDHVTKVNTNINNKKQRNSKRLISFFIF